MWLEPRPQSCIRPVRGLADKARELAAAQQEYNDLKERIDRPMEETHKPTPPPAPSVSNPADVPVDLDEQGFDMDLNNPGIEEEENEDEAGPAVKRKRLSHFDQMMAGLSHFDNESLVTFLGQHVQAHAEQQNAIAQEAAVVLLRVIKMPVGLETSPRMLLSGPGTRKISFSSLSPRLVKILIFFPGMLAKTGLPLLFQVPRVFRRSKALLHIAPLSLVQSLNWSRKSFRIQSSARMLLVWSVCCEYELALTLLGLLLIFLVHVCLVASDSCP